MLAQRRAVRHSVEAATLRSVLMEIMRYIVVGLSFLAGINVLRNPIKVWPNTLAGLSYFAGSAASVAFSSWWPLLCGWIGSLSMQALCTALIARGVFAEHINDLRAKKDLPPLGNTE
jgi:hypothetical protein